ncbi:PAS domain S-box-containing protein/diguanylate cyclase (GGDEF) domain-containing protein [Pelagirhabdus alkalitolerans]|uniref:PAS domain S-box-containing protein/diguanylate cyclase (GGDEF) domain-containing protein n=1 Tax=Pelagirhabdus alkalitolerans TaxID=1612202 RepID=A0A1G6H7R9_9BACI|nr:EAL domain-containing protein [Pelagirhabdus alkalitolerans]SDB90194.1 PAS domain S-box-containing protein/diguanylate cyclase (GGDEF) domain-containing protein [Pelagirhabdus alkalitolerans]
MKIPETIHKWNIYHFLKLLLINLMIVGSLFFILTYSSSNIISTYTEQDYRFMMERAGERIDDQFNHIFNDLRRLGSQVRFDERLVSDDHNERFDALHQLLIYSNVVDGGFIYTEEETIDSPIFQNNIRLETISDDIERVNSSRLSKSETISSNHLIEYIIPLHDDDSQVHLFIDLERNDTFASFFSTLEFTDNHFITLIDEVGRVLYENNQLTIDHPEDYLDQISDSIDLNLTEQTFHEIEQDDEDAFYVIHQQMRQTDWQLVLMMPKEVPSDVLSELNRALIPIFSLLALLLLIFVTYSSYRNAKPFNKLLTAITRISEGDYTHRIEVDQHPNKLSQVNNRFNIMVQELEEYKQDVVHKTEQLNQQKNFLDRIINNSPNIIYTMDQNGVYTMVNKPFAALYNLTPDELLGKTEMDVSHDKRRAYYFSKLNRSIMQSGEEVESEEKFVRPNGEVLWFHVSKQPIKGQANHSTQLLCVATDITEIKQQADYIHYQAHHDELTSLPNRKQFKETIRELIDSSDQNNHYFALMFLDLDRFKYVNDTFGHDAGDALLIEAAERLRKVVGDAHYAFRFGGDEFTILMTNTTDRQEVSEKAKEVLQILTEPYYFEEHKFIVTASIGISLYPKDSQSVNDLTKYADMAMYQAKQQGKNTFRFYTHDLQTEIANEERLEMDLYQAKERNELFVEYQPIHRMTDHKVIGIESFLRWQHNKLGLISPAEFIPIANKTGLIHQFGLDAFQETIQTIKDMNAKRTEPIYAHVNFSETQLLSDFLVDHLSHILNIHAFDPHLVMIEISELTLNRNHRKLKRILQDIKSLGCHIAIDDFGSSYASLNMIKRLPIDQIKMNASFIDLVLEDEEDDDGMLEKVFKMANKLNVKIVVDGIETEEQYQFIQEKDCYSLQGYLFSQTMTKEDLEQSY